MPLRLLGRTFEWKRRKEGWSLKNRVVICRIVRRIFGNFELFASIISTVIKGGKPSVHAFRKKWNEKNSQAVSVRKRKKDGNGLRSKRASQILVKLRLFFTFPFRIILCGLAKVVLLLLGEKKRLSKIKSDLISQLGNCGPLYSFYYSPLSVSLSGI